MQRTPSPGLFLFCRNGYEKDCASEIQALANLLACVGYCKTKTDSGHVIFCAQDYSSAETLYSSIDFSQLIFARQWFLVYEVISDLPESDRLTPILDCIQQASNHYGKFSQLIIQQANMESKDNLQRFISSFSHPLNKTLNQLDLVPNTNERHNEHYLQLCFTSASQVYIGYLAKGQPWQGGIPRLKIPETAPSRSYLKLEEAFIRFMGNQRNHYLKPAMTAADLGAAPGGWSWLLIQNHIKVTAVDNGPLDKHLIDSGLCNHIMQDAFKYEPSHPHDWLVCDIVDKPLRVVDLVNHWVEQNWCSYAIFNLKLPMLQRFKFIEKEVYPWLEKLLQHQQITRWRAKQLYHDRHEVTFMLE